ncbi:MAG: ATP-binding protein [Clostridia bacterium]|nr:ATP-binding protein [Clostridia bacterium]
MEITEGWHYRFGELPVDKNNAPLWLVTESSGWKPYTMGSSFPDFNGQKYIWLQVKLPKSFILSDPALMIKRLDQVHQVYLADKLIYEYGTKVTTPQKRPMDSFDLLKLPENFEDKFLTIQIHIDSIKAISTWAGAELGAYNEYSDKSHKHDLEYIIFSTIFIFMGLALIIAYIFLRWKTTKAYAALGFYSLCAGTYLISCTSIKTTFINSPQLWLYISAMSIYLLLAGICSFVEQQLKNKYSVILRRIWQAHVLHALFIFTGSLLNIIPLYSTYKIFLLSCAVAIIIIILSVRKSTSNGSTEGNTLAVGGFLASIFGIVDIINGIYHILPLSRLIFHWGIFIFVMTLIFSFAFRFIGMHLKLRDYSEKLEEKNSNLKNMWKEVKCSKDEIAQWNNTLERRVAERTDQLEYANQELTALNEELTALNEQMTATLEALYDTQSQLAQSEKMAAIGSLVSGIAHELNTPLASIKSNVQLDTMLLNSLESDDKQSINAYRDSVTSMNTISLAALNRLIKIVTDLANFSRFDETDYHKADINKCIDTAISQIEMPPSLKIELVKNYGSLPHVSCYPKQLNQVFFNILTNAIQALNSSGQITICTYYQNSKIHITIQDTGIGIASMHLSKIFDPGFTTKGVGIGLGLGLSVAYRIIEQHKGKIYAESTPGCGSKFTIELPARI